MNVRSNLPRYAWASIHDFEKVCHMFKTLKFTNITNRLTTEHTSRHSWLYKCEVKLGCMMVNFAFTYVKILPHLGRFTRRQQTMTNPNEVYPVLMAKVRNESVPGALHNATIRARKTKVAKL